MNIKKFFKSLEGAYSENTIRSYRCDYNHYATWCHKYQYNPLDTHENKFADYILQMGENLTVATIQRRVASPLCQDTCPLSNLSIQTKAGVGK